MRHVKMQFGPLIAVSIWSLGQQMQLISGFTSPFGNLMPHLHTNTHTHTTTESTRLYASEALAREGEWAAYFDQDNTAMIYYFNGQTGESRWEPPTPTFPSVELDGKQRRLMMLKQEERLKAAQAAANEEKKKQQQAAKAAAEKARVAEEKARMAAKAAAEAKAAAQAKAAEVQETTVESESTLGGGFFGSLFSGTEEAVNGNNGQVAVEEKPATTEPDRKPFGASSFNFPDVFSSTGTTATPTKKQPATTTPSKSKSTTTTTTTEVQPMTINAAVSILPHPKKVSWGGEDAAFYNSKTQTFGVFDGVSGADKRAGLSLYSYTLADQLDKLIKTKYRENMSNGSTGGINGKSATATASPSTTTTTGLTLREMTEYLTQAADYADLKATGASTALLASIGTDNILRVLNVGDSMLIVIRNNKVIARSKEILHYFECPYQLSIDSPDRPRDGTKFSLVLQKGDVVIMGSDGVFDNLDEEAVCKLVASAKASSSSSLSSGIGGGWGKNNNNNNNNNKKKIPSVIAKSITERSRKVSLNAKAVTPYSIAAKKNRLMGFEDGLGGKVDDVSCIAAVCS